MSIKQNVKGIIEQIPFPIGALLARMPFAWRLGKGYSLMWTECGRIEQGGAKAKAEYALEK